MTDDNFDRQFTNSCIPIVYPCVRGTKYIDPCTCKDYFLCEHPTSIITQVCSDGTFFNHVTGGCERDEDVAIIKKLCEPKRPWERCRNVTSDPSLDIPGLVERCTGVRPTTMPPGGPEQQTGGDNSGVIAGAIIGVLLVIALVVLAVVLLKKRGKPMSHYMSFLSKMRGGKAKGGNDEETYTEINDVMRDPVYNNNSSTKKDISSGGDKSPRVPDRPPFTLSPALNVSQQVKGQERDEVAYDNPGYTPSDDDVIQGSVNVRPLSSAPQLESSYSDLDQNSLDVPVARPYTPLSVYTRGPNPNATPASEGGILQVTDNDYQVPKPMPDYYELESGSNSVS